MQYHIKIFENITMIYASIEISRGQHIFTIVTVNYTKGKQISMVKNTANCIRNVFATNIH